jgi:hypothetical protein
MALRAAMSPIATSATFSAVEPTARIVSNSRSAIDRTSISLEEPIAAEKYHSQDTKKRAPNNVAIYQALAVLLQMELKCPGVGVSITREPGGFHEARTEVDQWAGKAGYSAAVSG